MDNKRKEELRNNLEAAYGMLINATTNAAYAEENVATAKVNLEIAKGEAYTNGSIQGKNDTERRAAEQVVLAAPLNVLQKATSYLEKCMTNRTIASLVVDKVKWLIRLEESTTELLTTELLTTVLSSSNGDDVPF
jgi:protoporphyrinogen oxidase